MHFAEDDEADQEEDVQSQGVSNRIDGLELKITELEDKIKANEKSDLESLKANLRQDKLQAKLNQWVETIEDQVKTMEKKLSKKLKSIEGRLQVNKMAKGASGDLDKCQRLMLPVQGEDVSPGSTHGNQGLFTPAEEIKDTDELLPLVKSRNSRDAVVTSIGDYDRRRQDNVTMMTY